MVFSFGLKVNGVMY